MVFLECGDYYLGFSFWRSADCFDDCFVDCCDSCFFDSRFDDDCDGACLDNDCLDNGYVGTGHLEHGYVDDVSCGRGASKPQEDRTPHANTTMHSNADGETPHFVLSDRFLTLYL